MQPSPLPRRISRSPSRNLIASPSWPTRMRRQIRKAEEVTRAHDAATAEVRLADARVAKAGKMLDLAKTGHDQIREVELLVASRREMVKDAQIALDSAKHVLQFTKVRAPFPGVVVKRYRSLGDFVSAGVPILSMYNSDLLYVTANLEETRLERRGAGQPCRIAARCVRPAVHGPRGLDQQINRRPIRVDAPECRRRRVHQGRTDVCRCESGSTRTTAGRSCAPVCRLRS